MGNPKHQQKHMTRTTKTKAVLEGRPLVARLGNIQAIPDRDTSDVVQAVIKSGRPRILSKSAENFSIVSSLRDRKRSSKELTQHLAASSGCQGDPSTVQ